MYLHSALTPSFMELYLAEDSQERVRNMYHLSDFKVCLSIQVRRFNVAHALWFTAMEGEYLESWSTL